MPTQLQNAQTREFATVKLANANVLKITRELHANALFALIRAATLAFAFRRCNLQVRPPGHTQLLGTHPRTLDVFVIWVVEGLTAHYVRIIS